MYNNVRLYCAVIYTLVLSFLQSLSIHTFSRKPKMRRLQNHTVSYHDHIIIDGYSSRFNAYNGASVIFPLRLLVRAVRVVWEAAHATHSVMQTPCDKRLARRRSFHTLQSGIVSPHHVPGTLLISYFLSARTAIDSIMRQTQSRATVRGSIHHLYIHLNLISPSPFFPSHRQIPTLQITHLNPNTRHLRGCGSHLPWFTRELRSGDTEFNEFGKSGREATTTSVSVSVSLEPPSLLS